jgi:hypothetical protein
MDFVNNPKREKILNQVIKKILLLAIFAISLILAACGGGGGSSGGGTVADNVSINSTAYVVNSSTVRVSGYQMQTSPSGYQTGGPVGVIWMNDTQTGNALFFQVVSTADGWPGVHFLYGSGTGTSATITDKSVTTGGLMVDSANGNGTGGSITIDTFGDIGQQITGSFNMNLCDNYTVCSASIKNYTGTFSVIRTANYGSLARPASVLIPVPASTSYTNGIHPASGKNYYAIPTNSTGGTLTLTLSPSVGFNLAPTVDVNMAVFTDAGFTTPATCDVTNTLNVAGNGVETCAVTVTANQRLYISVSQTATATAFETYTLKVAE